MKKVNIILAILLALGALLISSIPSNAQPGQMQVRIDKITFEGKGKATIEGFNMKGEIVVIKYGFNGGAVNKPKHTLLAKGTWLTVKYEDLKLRGENRAVIKLND